MSFLHLLIEMVCNLTGVLVALHLPNYQGDTTVFNTESHAFESSQDLIIRRLIVYWKASCISLTMFHHCIMQFLRCIPCYVHPAFIVFRIVQSIVFVYPGLLHWYRGNHMTTSVAKWFTLKETGEIDRHQSIKKGIVCLISGMYCIWCTSAYICCWNKMRICSTDDVWRLLLSCRCKVFSNLS